jgi:hypothetical protein
MERPSLLTLKYLSDTATRQYVPPQPLTDQDYTHTIQARRTLPQNPDQSPEPFDFMFAPTVTKLLTQFNVAPSKLELEHLGLIVSVSMCGMMEGDRIGEEYSLNDRDLHIIVIHDAGPPRTVHVALVVDLKGTWRRLWSAFDKPTEDEAWVSFKDNIRSWGERLVRKPREKNS